MILPFLAGPFGVFLMRQYILTLPDELIQAARIDGAGEMRIFASVILPLCGPALATLGILTFLGSWNNFLWPLVVAQTEDKYTLPVALALYAVGQNATQYGLLLAGSVVVVVPVLAAVPVPAAPHHARHRHDGHQVAPVPPFHLYLGTRRRNRHALAHPTEHRLGRPRVGRPRPRDPAAPAPRRPPPAPPVRPRPLPAEPVLDTYLRDTWKSFTAMVDPGTGLVSDNIGGDLSGPTRAGYTSPTNIGAYLWCDRGRPATPG